MKEVNAVIGGEGNGGVIYPELHYGRDALVGVALFLTALAQRGGTMTALRNTLPQYIISKNKISLQPDTDINALLEAVKKHFSAEKINTKDGVRIDFESSREWVHLRRSNTEPIIRIYAESSTVEKADKLAASVKQIIENLS
jgi:phosphomannomutase